MDKSMSYFICLTCGTQYPASENPPAHCPICEDERQYVGHNGQEWTTLEALQKTHKNVVKEEEAGLIGIGTEPRFAIGQRGLLVQHPEGNILWDCISLIDDETIGKVKELGGINKIAISHPHYYSSMIEWSKAFDAPIYLHEAERKWVMRPDAAVQFWQGETFELAKGLTLIRCGGHYEGAQVLHWVEGAGRKGVLLTGDIVNVVSDRRYVSFMYSFPNLIPLPASAIRRIQAALEPFAYDRIYSAWFGNIVKENAKAGVKYSAERYIKAITD
jgi:glyoxylase-like metal-dependent hydrolase (beta-lactamase superfamily II)